MTRMGRRPTGGAGPNHAVLRRHIKLASKNHNLCADVDQLVEHLRSAHPPYSRLKLTPFRSMVSRIVTQISPSPKRLIDDDDVGSDESALNKKKIRKFDDREEKLRLIEESHVRKGKVLGDNNVTSGGSSSSLASASSDSDDSSSGEGSTSEDAVYGEEYEPEHDLMKSLMRDKLLRNGKKESKQDVELEVVNDKDVKSLGQTDGKRLALGDDGRSSRDGGRSNDGGGDGVHAPKFKDLGGMHNVIEELMIEVIVPLCYPQLPRFLGVKPISGILLHGPPGCGKTKLAHAIANETGLPFYKISATELVSGVSGASEENLRALFDKAHETTPSIVFIDEIDAIASKRENLQREMERRIVTQLMTCMDELHRGNKPGYVLVIGATNRADAVDPALRRGGRFDREIHIGVPDESARAQILSVLTKNLKVEGAFDLNKIARSTPGFVGADLRALTNKAGILAMKRIIDKRKVELSSSSSKESTDQERCEDWWRQPWSDNELDSLNITMYDFEEAAKTVQPSLTREGFSTVPNVKWDDVGGLCSLREEFDHCIVRRIKFPKDYDDFGVNLETGFVLWGPPGCGKTLIAKAVANEAGANFIHVKGPELLNKYVGESELGVRTMFTRARTCSPCILFFDEIDALTTKRGKEGGWVVERVLNQLLIELDGAEQRRGVFVIGATNRVEVMDPAILRPGRLGKLMYVPLPSSDERGMILKASCRNKPIDSDVDLMAIAGACENFSGADLSALVNEAAMAALNDNLTARSDGRDGKDKSIKGDHFRRALEKISPSVSESQRRYYESLFQKLHKRKDSLDSSSSTLPPTYSYS